MMIDRSAHHDDDDDDDDDRFVPSVCETPAPSKTEEDSVIEGGKGRPEDDPTIPQDDTLNSSTCTSSSCNESHDHYHDLSRQLEYYFSTTNLKVDTYLQTLRSLNDGCVPIPILANFSKVQMIVAQISNESSSKKESNRNVALSESSSESSSSSSLSPPPPPHTNSHHNNITERTSSSVSSSSSCSCSTRSCPTDDPKVSSNKSNSNNSSKAQLRLLQELQQDEEQRRIDAILHVVQHSQYCPSLQIYTIDCRTGKIITSSSSTSSKSILALGYKEGYVIPKESDTLVSNHDVVATSRTTTTPTLSSSSSSSSSNALDGTNTLILRDVHPNVDEIEIRSLLESVNDCPIVVQMIPDVADCWFITFATADRYDLIRVMMQLRTMAYPSNGDPVMVRLRASVVPSQSTIIQVDSYDHRQQHSHTIHPLAMVDPTMVPKKKRRKKRRPKNKKSKTSTTTSVATTTSLTTSDASITDTTTTTTNKVLSSLDLTHDDFPSLSRISNNDNDKVDWTTDSIDMANGSINDDDDIDIEDVEDEISRESSTNKEDECFEEDGEVEGHNLAVKLTSRLRLHHSDTASTATTTSSNASSGSDPLKSPPPPQSSSSYYEIGTTTSPVVFTGYAAAARRTIAPSLPIITVNHTKAVKEATTVAMINDSHTDCDSKEMPSLSVSTTPSLSFSFSPKHQSMDHEDPNHDTFKETTLLDPDVVVKAPPPPIKWGSRRSFVDVIREKSIFSNSGIEL